MTNNSIYTSTRPQHRQIEVTIEADQIVIKRVGDAADSDED